MDGEVTVTLSIKRHPPWLQRALRIRQDTEAFWTHGCMPRGQVEASSSLLHPVGNAVEDETDANANASAAQQEEWRFASLREAVRADAVAHVRRVLTAHPELITARMQDGGCDDSYGGGDIGGQLLHYAAWHGAVRVVEYVLDLLKTQYTIEKRIAVVNAIDTVASRMTPLLAACQSAQGMMPMRLQLVRALVDVGGAVIDHQDAHGDNALHWCARTSNVMLLRFFLSKTDAGANAVFADNYKRETPLAIAERELARKRSVSTISICNLLRATDRKCDLLLKMRVMQRKETTAAAQREAELSRAWMATVDASQIVIEQADKSWMEAITRAEANRHEAETAQVNAAVNVAEQDAAQWLETKEGKSFVRQQVAATGDKFRKELQRGAMAKPMDLKKAATQYVHDRYIREQEQSARQTALARFRATRPSYPSDPVKVRALVGL